MLTQSGHYVPAVSAIHFAAVADAEDENILAQEGKDDAVVADTQFAQPGKRALELRIALGVVAQLFLDPVQNAARLGLVEIGQIFLDALLVLDVIGQATFSDRGWRSRGPGDCAVGPVRSARRRIPGPTATART